MRNSKAYSPTLILPLVLSAACDAQVDTQYQGEAMATITGTVTNELRYAPPEATVTLVWWLFSASNSRIVAEAANVSGGFPARFRLDIFAPPGDDALNDYRSIPGGGRVGVAMLVVADFERSSEVFGAAEEHFLIYVADELGRESLTSKYFAGVTEPGFHLMEVIDVDDPDCAEELVDCFVRARNGFATEVPVRLAEDFDLPSFF